MITHPASFVARPPPAVERVTNLYGDVASFGCFQSAPSCALHHPAQGASSAASIVGFGAAFFNSFSCETGAARADARRCRRPEAPRLDRRARPQAAARRRAGARATGGAGRLDRAPAKAAALDAAT